MTSNGRYLPQTRPIFVGDDWHELRDALYEERVSSMSLVAGQVAQLYRRSAVVMDRKNDAMLLALERDDRFDIRKVYLAHAHLAAYWRLQLGHTDPMLPGTVDLYPYLKAFEKWALGETTTWFLDNPMLLRHWVRVLVSRRGKIASEPELDLWREMKLFYPLPAAEQPDLIEPGF